MLIDAFSKGWIEELDQQARALGPSCRLLLLVDGAFIPGLHKSLANDRKALLFASLPGCSELAKDASPFLTPYNPQDKQLRALVQCCNRWPMLSALETPESLEQVAARLAGWCVVEADAQRFNFRFSDTRRLPAILRMLTPQQRVTFVGQTKRWSYVGRDGHWSKLPLGEIEGKDTAEPILDEYQFASLVDDSGVDERLVLLRDRGRDVFACPSRSHVLLATALRAARTGRLDEDDVLEWCDWFWNQGKLLDDNATLISLQRWQKES